MNCYFTRQKLSKFSKTCFTTTKETASSLFNLAHLVYAAVADCQYKGRMTPAGHSVDMHGGVALQGPHGQVHQISKASNYIHSSLACCYRLAWTDRWSRGPWLWSSRKTLRNWARELWSWSKYKILCKFSLLM